MNIGASHFYASAKSNEGLEEIFIDLTQSEFSVMSYLIVIVCVDMYIYIYIYVYIYICKYIHP
jgi:hypothetical protein